MTENSWGKKLWDYRKNLGVSRKKFAEMLNINEGTLRSYETEQRKPGFETYEKIEAIINQSGENRKDSENMNELLRTKDKLIASLEREKELMKKLNSLKSKKDKKLDDTYFNKKAEIIFEFDIQINWLNPFELKVRYNNQTSNYIPLMAEKLGYSINEMTDMLMIDQMVPYKDHNIHKLRSQKQKEQMLDNINNYMKAFNNVKMTTNLLVANIPVSYTAKNGQEFLANVEYRISYMKGNGRAFIRWAEEA